MIRLLMADDHAIVLGGLKELLALVDGIQVAGEASNGEQVLQNLGRDDVDMILLDMNMPGPSGVDLIARIRLQAPRLPILVLSMHNELQVARAALKAGANGYLTKDSEPEMLIGAIRKVAAGRRFIDPMLADQMTFDAYVGNARFRHEHLSPREFHLMNLLAGGKSVGEIAVDLGLSRKTISTHKNRLMQKMEFRNNADLVRYGIECGLVNKASALTTAARD
jgi:DNA-binding NarL/FixJ family response regulator